MTVTRVLLDFNLSFIRLQLEFYLTLTWVLLDFLWTSSLNFSWLHHPLLWQALLKLVVVVYWTVIIKITSKLFCILQTKLCQPTWNVVSVMRWSSTDWSLVTAQLQLQMYQFTCNHKALLCVICITIVRSMSCFGIVVALSVSIICCLWYHYCFILVASESC